MEMSSANIQGQVARHQDDRSGQIAAVVSVMIGLVTVAVVLRLFTRWSTATSWKLDDYGVIAALVSNTAKNLDEVNNWQYLPESGSRLRFVYYADRWYEAKTVPYQTAVELR